MTDTPTSAPEIAPRADRVIARLQAQLAEAYGQIAMLEDVVAQHVTERAKAALPAARDNNARGDAARDDAAAGGRGVDS